MPRIAKLSALEILDSRGRPTVAVRCELEGGASAKASVPSGASTGRDEAHELRDGDRSRYGGLGCTKAVFNVNEPINAVFAGREFGSQRELDAALLDLDGTANKSNLGANAILAVSVAYARAAAVQRGTPLYRHLAELVSRTNVKLPRLTVNLFSGGKHAGGQVAIQDVLVVPHMARSIDQALSMTYRIYQAAVRVTQNRYQTRALVADEGGLAPPFPSIDAMLQDAVDSISIAGYQPGREVAIAIDVAATHFWNEGRYQIGDESLDSAAMIARVANWTTTYPIISVEDGLAEDDWANWPALRKAIPQQTIVMGDDLLCTNPRNIKRAIELSAADALLLKVNQIGTLTEAADAYRLARDAGWTITVSARSGETEDDWLADLATGWSGDFIKVGSITRSERLAKYNRLLEIEQMLYEER
jgi:enolase